MENLVFEIQASIGLGDVKLMSKDRDLEPRLQQKDGGRMGRKRKRRKGGSRTEGLRRTFAAVASAHRQSKTCWKKANASGKPVGPCEVVKKNRRRFHGLVKEFRASRIQNVVDSSDHTEGPNDSARARWSATQRKLPFGRYQLREWEQLHG